MKEKTTMNIGIVMALALIAVVALVLSGCSSGTQNASLSANISAGPAMSGNSGYSGNSQSDNSNLTLVTDDDTNLSDMV